MSIRIEVFKEKETQPYLRLLAQMRLSEYKEFPYLYVGNMEEDFAITNYFTFKDGLLVIAFQGETVAGMYSGVPMCTPSNFLQDCSVQLAGEGVDINKCFYASDLIVNPRFKRQGIGVQLLKRLFQEVKAMGYDTIMGVTSFRPLDHPLRPKDYFDTDSIWEKHGYKKSPLVFSLTYPTRQADGTVKMEANDLGCVIASFKN